MRIGSYDVKMAGSHSAEEVRTSEERLKYWIGNDTAEITRIGNSSEMSNGSSDLLEISQEALELQKKNSDNKNVIGKTGEADNDSTFHLSISEKDKLKIMLIEDFISKLTGKKFNISIFSKIKIKGFDEEAMEDFKALQNQEGSSSAPQRQGWGLEYNFHSTYHESEKMTFKAKGIVKTEDGRTIDFSLNLKMSREFASQTNINIKAGDAAIDPLVINYSGKALDLTDNKILFDIDLDGNRDNISFTSEGSGFLALDLNSDGTINDGKELFGPATGNGFEELRQYDSDNNNWIDENDSIYNRLSIWTKDENGNDKLFALGAAGIGAIYVGNIDTEFNIKNSENTSLGNIRSSGAFLREDGTAGTIHHIDLTI